jgi:alpha-amylase
MPDITSIHDIDLRPIANKVYFNIDREWREEFIYFLMVDRFHDDRERVPINQPGRAVGIAAGDNFYGGTIKGITRNLDYIAGLGCTAIWLSPVLENNPGAYHGYNTNNYLGIDPHFGTRQDLIELVEVAHNYRKNGEPFPLRIIMDVVINHSGDNWFYPGDVDYHYHDDEEFPLGGWRRNDRPIPTEMRNEAYYYRRGNMRNYDTYPENQHGDMSGLKDFRNDDTLAGSDVINILIRSYCYWIREADIDGFRVDAIKHMGELACSRFCSAIREYAYALGKRGFFLFGELAVADDEIYNRYIGQNTSRLDGNKTVFFGINSLLDFRLAKGIDQHNPPLSEVIKGNRSPQTLFDRLAAQEKRALNRGEIGRYLVTFIDNHDAFWQPEGRFAATASDEQVIGAIGFLLCALGTPCIYYGTEQGFAGRGDDIRMREAMFDQADGGHSLLNRNCLIYQEIATIAQVMRSTAPLRFGRMYYRQISENGAVFGFPYGTEYTLAFSRMLYGREVLAAYNVSGSELHNYVIVDAAYHQPGDTMHFLYPSGREGVLVEQTPDGGLCVRIRLRAREFVILE